MIITTIVSSSRLTDNIKEIRRVGRSKKVNKNDIVPTQEK
jgi:hypothetical protein